MVVERRYSLFMPQPQNSQFDQTVLDMIEHSPVGAVPVTPAYQDAIRRLYASHQAYPDADHKNGHVTARSLIKLPSFYASNLDAVVAGQARAEELEPNAKIFDRYVQSLPALLRAKAEGFRLTVAGKVAHHRAKHGGDAIHDPVHTHFLVPGTGPHPGLPGNYLHGSALQISADAATSRWAVTLHDSDDGVASYDAPNMADGLAKLQEVLASAPFNMNELEALGFRLG
jgi:hypothetical protein